MEKKKLPKHSIRFEYDSGAIKNDFDYIEKVYRTTYNRCFIVNIRAYSQEDAEDVLQSLDDALKEEFQIGFAWCVDIDKLDEDEKFNVDYADSYSVEAVYDECMYDSYTELKNDVMDVYRKWKKDNKEIK